ncbi:LapA family protein [Nostoc sp. FACHB-152]|uniref:LapA family protein n=1 Tax=unclassified Nostoc TaxID=2593658 RepID=UPI001684D036|nr:MULTISPECIES: LapA family protein [unclassified Nostoc]MBD2449456.1 LapA family protein [Nostoc sp. FACHB-152]MBD2470779.1 LapA family protein [Nostoc sp. FACHB-145]
MAVIRLILLVAILGGLTLLLVQNWSPAISLVFLGMRTQPLPLAMWILFVTTAGALTSVLLTTLFKLSSYFEGQPRQNPSKSTASSRRVKTPRREEPTSTPFTSPSSASQNQAAASEEFDDWETRNTNDDWDFEEQPPQTPPRPKTQPGKNFEPEERQREPKSSSQTGSVYSYSYREPKNTAVGKTESVYDADYRVIIPPYKQSDDEEPANNADDDDWSFFEDDEFGDDNKPRK